MRAGPVEAQIYNLVLPLLEELQPRAEETVLHGTVDFLFRLWPLICQAKLQIAQQLVLSLKVVRRSECSHLLSIGEEIA